MIISFLVIAFLVTAIGFVTAMLQMQNANTKVRERIEVFRERREERKKKAPKPQPAYNRERPRATDEQIWDDDYYGDLLTASKAEPDAEQQQLEGRV